MGFDELSVRGQQPLGQRVELEELRVENFFRVRCVGSADELGEVDHFRAELEPGDKGHRFRKSLDLESGFLARLAYDRLIPRLSGLGVAGDEAPRPRGLPHSSLDEQDSPGVVADKPRHAHDELGLSDPQDAPLQTARVTADGRPDLFSHPASFAVSQRHGRRNARRMAELFTPP